MRFRGWTFKLRLPGSEVRGSHQSVSLPVLSRSLPAAVKRSTLARLRTREGFESVESPQSGDSSSAHLLPVDAAARLVLIVLSTHLEHQVTCTATDMPLIQCFPAVSTDAHRQWESSDDEEVRVAAVLILFAAAYTVPAHPHAARLVSGQWQRAGSENPL